MFIFGDPEQIATMTMDSVESEGPGLPKKPLDEQTVGELRTTITLCRLGIHKGRSEGVSQEALDTLLQWHDDAFKALAEASEQFREFFKSTRYDYPRPKTAKNKAFYRSIVDKAASES